MSLNPPMLSSTLPDIHQCWDSLFLSTVQLTPFPTLQLTRPFLGICYLMEVSLIVQLGIRQPLITRSRASPLPLSHVLLQSRYPLHHESCRFSYTP